MAKLILVTLALSALVASALAVGGVQDWLGNYHDGTTGQISSSLTGKVYNTRPTGWGPVDSLPAAYAAAPLVAHASYAAPLVAHASYAAPLVSHAAYAAPYAAYASPYAAYASPYAYGAYGAYGGAYGGGLLLKK